MTVGDPGYTGACLQFHVPVIGVKPGRWRATVVHANLEGHGLRCAVLFAHHVDHPCALDEPIWESAGSIDVEYATAGIFDCARYYDPTVVPTSVDPPRAGEHPWYDLCVTRAHGRPGSYEASGAGTVPFGCVSASGPGDGSYPCFAARTADRAVVGLCLDFRSDDDDADE